MSSLVVGSEDLTKAMAEFLKRGKSGVLHINGVSTGIYIIIKASDEE